MPKRLTFQLLKRMKLLLKNLKKNSPMKTSLVITTILSSYKRNISLTLKNIDFMLIKELKLKKRLKKRQRQRKSQNKKFQKVLNSQTTVFKSFSTFLIPTETTLCIIKSSSDMSNFQACILNSHPLESKDMDGKLFKNMIKVI